MASVEEFTPTRVVVLGELSAREKEKYYSILVSQDAKFHYDRKGRIISNVRLLHAKARRVIEESKVDHVKKEIGFEDRLKRLNELPANGITIILRGVPDFDYNLYTIFVALASEPGEIIYPKRHVLTWVMRLVEDFYDSRFTFEKLHVQKDPTLSNSGKLESFPIFVMKHLCTLVGLKRIVDQFAWDLLWNAHNYRRDYLDVEIFMRFMQQIYDNDDLLFFLYARSVIAKQLNINYKRRWVNSESMGKGPKTTWMSFKEVSFISRTIFGSGDENRQILSEFMNLVTRHIVGKKAENSDSRRIDIIQFLHLAVVTYHQMNVDGSWGNASRGGGGQGTVEAMNNINLNSTIDEPTQHENTIPMDTREIELEDAGDPFDSVSKRAYVPLNPNPPVPTSVAAKLTGPPKRKDPIPQTITNTSNSADVKINNNDDGGVATSSSVNKDGYTLDQLESLDDFDEFLRQDNNNHHQQQQQQSSSSSSSNIVSAIRAAEMEQKYKKRSSKMNTNNNTNSNDDTPSPNKSVNSNKPTVLSTEERMMLANQFSRGSLGAALYGGDDSNNIDAANDVTEEQNYQDNENMHPDEAYGDIDGDGDGEYRDAWIVAAEMSGIRLDEADDFEQCFMDKAQDVLGALLEDIDGLNDDQQSHVVDVLYDMISVEVNEEFTQFSEIRSLEDFDEVLRSIITSDQFMEFIASARDKVLSEII